MTSPHARIIGEIYRLIDSATANSDDGILSAHLRAVELLTALGVTVQLNSSTTPTACELRTAIDHALLRYALGAPASSEVATDRDT